MADDTVVVDVQARLTNLDRNLAEGERRIGRFATTVEQQSARVDRAFAKPGKGRSAADALLGDVRAMRAQSEALLVDVQRLDQAGTKVAAANDRAGRSFGRTAGSAAVAGVAMYAVSQNLSELEGGAGRAGKAMGNLISGNFVGFWKEARSEIGTTTEEMLKTNDAAGLVEVSTTAAAAGFDKLAASATAAASALISANAAADVAAALGATAARTGLTGDAADAATFGERSGPYGRGPGAVAREGAGVFGPVADPLVGLSQRLQTAVAAARSTPGVKDDVAQLRRAADALQGQLGQGGITDADREQIYSAIAAINSEIKTLTATKKPAKGKEPPIVPFAFDIALESAGLTKQISDDLAALKAIDAYLVKKIAVETDQNRKLQEIGRLGQVRAQLASLTAATERAAVTDLFGGPVLTSRPYEFAKQYGFEADAGDLLKDIRGQVAAEKAFAANLKTLSRKGASGDLISTLAGQGADQAGSQVAALAGADRGLVKQYDAAFTTRQRQEQQLANMTANVQTATINIGRAVVAGRGPGGRMKFETSGLAGAR